MLKISTKTRYGLRALLEMACCKGKKCFTLKELAKHQNISRKYLENIFALLKKRGIVHSIQGKKGGFYLTSQLKDISILKIIETLEGEVDLVNCYHFNQPCEMADFCTVRTVWHELNKSIKKILASKNLEDLSQEREIQEKCAYLIKRSKKNKRL